MNDNDNEKIIGYKILNKYDSDEHHLLKIYDDDYEKTKCGFPKKDVIVEKVSIYFDKKYNLDDIRGRRLSDSQIKKIILNYLIIYKKLNFCENCFGFFGE